jgi:hypothetical protein
MCLLLAVSFVTLPFSRTVSGPAYAASAMSIEHKHTASHHHGENRASVPHCPGDGSNPVCDMLCGVTQCESANLDFMIEPIVRYSHVLFDPPHVLLAGLGFEPPDQPPRS